MFVACSFSSWFDGFLAYKTSSSPISDSALNNCKNTFHFQRISCLIVCSTKTEGLSTSFSLVLFLCFVIARIIVQFYNFTSYKCFLSITSSFFSASTTFFFIILFIYKRRLQVAIIAVIIAFTKQLRRSSSRRVEKDDEKQTIAASTAYLFLRDDLTPAHSDRSQFGRFTEISHRIKCSKHTIQDFTNKWNTFFERYKSLNIPALLFVLFLRLWLAAELRPFWKSDFFILWISL